MGFPHVRRMCHAWTGILLEKPGKRNGETRGHSCRHLAGPGVGGAEPDTARPTATAPPGSVRTNLGGLAYDALPKSARRTSYALRISSGRRRAVTSAKIFSASRSFTDRAPS